MIDHFYKCFSCDKEHGELMQAIVCCLVIKELWRCKACGADFADAVKAHKHKRNGCRGGKN